MAEKLERTYVIPLRKEFQKAPRYKRAKKSITAIREFISKHMKSDDVKIGRYLNEKVWQHGIKNPPTKVEVKAVKEEETVKVELLGAPEEVKEEPKKKEVPKPEKPEEAPKEVPKAEELAKKKEEPKEKIPTAKELKDKKTTTQKSSRTPSSQKTSE